jgi:hypothetical protein
VHRISLGKTFTPEGEGRRDTPPDDAVRELEPGANFALAEFVHAEPGPSVYSLGVTPEDVELASGALSGFSKKQVEDALGAMPPTQRREFLDGLRQEAAARDAAKLRQTTDSARRADWQRHAGQTNAYAQRMAAHSATRDAAHASVHGVEAPTPIGRPGQTERAGHSYDALAAFKANMDGAHATARNVAVR